MKKTIFILGALLMANVAFATWSEPSVSPPGGNVPAPINVGMIQQNKNGNIGAKAFCLPGSGNYADCASGSWDSFIKGIVNNTYIQGIVDTLGYIKGFGTTGNLTKWTSANTIGDSIIVEADLLSGSGTNGFLAGWTGGKTLGNSGISIADADLWRKDGIKVYTKDTRVIDARAGLMVEVVSSDPGSPEVGRMWLVQL